MGVDTYVVYRNQFYLTQLSVLSETQTEDTYLQSWG